LVFCLDRGTKIGWEKGVGIALLNFGKAEIEE